MLDGKRLIHDKTTWKSGVLEAEHMPRKKGADMEKSIEQTFAELDELMEKLESPDTSLEESFACYEAGMKLVEACSDKIDKVEKQMIILQGGAEEDGDA